MSTKEIINVSKKTTKVTICVACYNGEKYIDKLFEKLSQIDFDSYEILIINDGSTDNSVLKIHENIKKYNLEKNVTLYSQSNRGLSAVRNKQIELAKGEYITFVDIDDWIEPSSIEKLYNKAIEDDYDIVVGRVNVVYNEKIYLPFLIQYVFKSNKTSSGLFVKSKICTPWGSLFKKSIFNNRSFLENYSFEDIGTLNYIFLKNNHIAYIKDIVYYYRRGVKGSLSNFERSNMWKLIDLYHQADFAMKKYRNEGWIYSKKHVRLINGATFQILIVVIWLSKYYSNNSILNHICLLSFQQLIKSYNLQLRFSKTFWKTLSFFYIKIFYSKTNAFLKFKLKLKLLFIPSFKKDIKNIKRIYYLNNEFIISQIQNFSTYKKASFLIDKNIIMKNRIEDSNVFPGIKLEKITKDILLNEKIYFIDLSSIKKKFNEEERFLIKKVNSRILIFLDKKFSEDEEFRNMFNIIFI